eukprot:TRINITY_DN41505_c0_g1_i1.p1 TRINITY_DN41505_c0_g1~~TRINITY_DN41505_c0_g1_i1.p1  ORF type:complete len:654 (-),score=158.98 TRINITY_DN41505_c0_g1_i1:70-1914(-)
MVALTSVVQSHIANGEPWRALWASEEAIARFQQRRDRRNEALALLHLVQAYINSPSGKVQVDRARLKTKPGPPPQEAVDACQQALTIAHELQDFTLETKVMAKLSSMHAERQEMKEAAMAAQDVLINQKAHNIEEKAVALRSLSASYAADKDFGAAKRAAEAARDLCKDARLQRGEAAALLSLADVFLAEHLYAESIESAKEAQAVFHEAGDRCGEAQALQHVSKIRHANGQPEKALHAAERAIELFHRFGDITRELEVLLVSAEIRSKMLRKRSKASKMPLPWEEISKASKSCKDALNLAKKHGDFGAQASALCSMTQVHIIEGRSAEALESADGAMAFAVEANDVKNEATAVFLSAEVHFKDEDLQKALKLARQAELMFQEIKDDDGLKQTVELLDRLREHEFRVDEDLAGLNKALPSTLAQIQNLVNPLEIKSRVQEVTKNMVGSASDLDESTPLMEIGINSMNAVMFRNKLSAEFPEMNFPSTLVFDYPTVKDVIELVLEKEREIQYAKLAEQAALTASAATALDASSSGAVESHVNSRLQEVARGMVGSPNDIEADMPLMEIGINSMNAVMFRKKLADEFSGVNLPSTLVFDYPTIRDVRALLTSISNK